MIETDGVGIKNEKLATFEEDVTASCMWLLGNINELILDTKEEH